MFADDAVKLRTRFGIVVSRAAIPLLRWLPLASQLVAPGGVVMAMISLTEALPPPPATLKLTADETYDVGAGPYRLLTYAAAGH